MPWPNFAYMDYAIAKSLHIIFMVAWYAGLFYIVRLMIYEREAQERPAQEADVLIPQMRLMQRRLWHIIIFPGMALTVIFGTWMLILNPILLKAGFMHVKLALVAGLLIYQFVTYSWFRKAGSAPLTKSSSFLRIWNEVATLFLFAIVFTVVMKNGMSWLYGVGGLLALAILLMAGIRIYKATRKD